MNFIKTILQDKQFLKKTFAITIPIVLQNLLNNVLNLVDTLMIGKLGDTAIASVGLANKVFFVFSLLMFGVCSGSGILAAQYWGKKEIFNIRRALRLAIIIGVSCSMLFMIPALLDPNFVMRIFTPDSEIISFGAEYLLFIAVSYPLTAITNAYVAILRSMNYVKLPVVITIIAICVNITLNYGLIFGKLGLPEMGVAGAALATTIARVVECGSLLLILHFRKAGDGAVGDFVHMNLKKAAKEYAFTEENIGHNEYGKFETNDKKTAISHKKIKIMDTLFLKKYFTIAFPVIANEFMWGLGVTAYSLVYGRMGKNPTAAITIANTVEQVALVFFFGICSAAAVVLGNELGENRLKDAERHAKAYIYMEFILTIIGALAVFLLKDFIISWFQPSDVVAHYVRMCLTVFACFMPIRMLNALLIVAILRCGGDTRFALFIDVSSVWLIGIPMAILGGLVFKLPIYLVYAMILVEEVYKLIFGYLRYRKKKWLRNIIA